MRRPTLSGPLHATFHVALVVLGWVLFVGLWWQVARSHVPGLEDLILLLVAALLVFPSVTLYWVRHNLAIYRRKGPRRRVPDPIEAYTHDWLGRPVQASFADARLAALVEIESTATEKRFLTPPPVSPDGVP